MGPSLGAAPVLRDSAFAGLTAAVVEMEDGAFYHFGSSRQLIETTCALQNDSLASGRIRGPRVHPDQIIQNAVMDLPTRRVRNHTLWVENSFVPSDWRLGHSHVLTGIPEGCSGVTLCSGMCVDVVPLHDGGVCVRPYGIDASFTGAVSSADTQWMGAPLIEWLGKRGLSLRELGIADTCDAQDAPLFPVLDEWWPGEGLVKWILDDSQASDRSLAQYYLGSPRLSARQLLVAASPSRLQSQRKRFMRQAFDRLWEQRDRGVFYQPDLARTAQIASTEPTIVMGDQEAIQRMYDYAWLAAVQRTQGKSADSAETRAFEALRDAILDPILSCPANPRCTVGSDQIVWGRSPVRLALAGGWTDTPPYCILHGGHVTNVAVNLNGQPPVQCFVGLGGQEEIRLYSIDRGETESIRTFEELDTFSGPGTSFAIAKAALALAGFLPRFSGISGIGTLREFLRRFGGGLDIALLATVPQGSGLGTSSILAATVLAALSNVCGLGWDTDPILSRTLALEQLMTTGGGWQDQAGAVWPGAKLVESEPGLVQQLSVRWAPTGALTAGCVVLLYYTGLTRLAKGILQEIVRGLFLNEGQRLRIVRDIGENAHAAFDALQLRSERALGEAVARSWDLNQALDSGTNPPAVQAILDKVADYLIGAKLLGAGGSGYLLMITKDPGAAERAQVTLNSDPPNDRARFVRFQVSGTRLEVTRS